MKKNEIRKIDAGIITILIITLFLSSFANAQTDSLAVWENIADGVLICDCNEVSDANWTASNTSGVWQYNVTTYSTNWTVNLTTSGNRWFSTFEYQSDNVALGFGNIYAYKDEGNFSAWVYFLDNGTGPQLFLMNYTDGEINWYNGTGWETNISNATSYCGQEAEFDYYSGFVRSKTEFNSYSQSLRVKIWDPTGDEPIDWVFDLYHSDLVPDNSSAYYDGLIAVSYDEIEYVGHFRSIMFWNLSYDTYLSTGIPQIACPTYSALDFVDEWYNYSDEENVWNSTQLLKNFINRFDLTSLFTNDSYDGLTDQNDTVYHFSIMLTDVRDLLEYFFDEEPTEDIPDNILFMRTYETIDGSSNDSDYMLLKIDTDNNGLYDSYDVAFWTNDTSFIVYEGNTSLGEDSYEYGIMMSGASTSDPLGEVFRDDLYYVYTTLINWDVVYNGSSEERIGDDVCRMSINWYNYDQENLTVLQDFDIVNDTEMITPPSDNKTWDVGDDTSLWLYFYVDDTISGDPMANPEDPVDVVITIDIDVIMAMVNAVVQIAVIILFLGISFEMLKKIKI